MSDCTLDAENGLCTYVCFHIFFAGEPLWTGVALERSHTRVSHHVAFQVPGPSEFPSTYVTVQFPWLLVEFAVFLKIVNGLEFLPTIIIRATKPEGWSR